MAYIRVIPRDLFNDGNLLKCVGALYIELESCGLNHIELAHDGEPFEIDQQDSDGATFLVNIDLNVGDVAHRLYRPMNSREPWPLYIVMADESDMQVFTEQGELSREFLDYCESVAP